MNKYWIFYNLKEMSSSICFGLDRVGLLLLVSEALLNNHTCCKIFLRVGIFPPSSKYTVLFAPYSLFFISFSKVFIDLMENLVQDGCFKYPLLDIDG